MEKIKKISAIILTAFALANLLSCEKKNGEVIQKQRNGSTKVTDVNCKSNFIEIESFSPFRKYTIQIHVPFNGEPETTWVKMINHGGKVADSSFSIFRNEDRLKEIADYIEKGESDSFEGFYLDAEEWYISYCSKDNKKKFELNNYIIQNRENCTKESLHFNKLVISAMEKIEIGTRKNKDIIHEAMTDAKTQFNYNGYKDK